MADTMCGEFHIDSCLGPGPNQADDLLAALDAELGEMG
jgi:hypothetical protein